MKIRQTRKELTICDKVVFLQQEKEKEKKKKKKKAEIRRLETK